MPVAHRHDVAFILNDNPELAAKYDCDGAHIGQDDMAYEAARAIMGDDKIIGVTCHDSKHLAMEAGEAGAIMSPLARFMRRKPNKPKPKPPLIFELLARIVELPCVAIGGITPDNAAPLVAAGADLLLPQAVFGSMATALRRPRAFNEIFDATHEK